MAFLGAQRGRCSDNHAVVVSQIGGGDVKSLQGVAQFFARQIGDQLMKHAEAIAHLIGLLEAANHINTDCGTDVADAAPKRSFRFHPVALAELQRDHPWHFPQPFAWLTGFLAEFALHVLAHLHEVVHHLFRALKHLGVDALHHKTLGNTLAVLHQEGVIHIAVAQRFDRSDLAMAGEPAGNAGELVLGLLLLHAKRASRLKLPLVRPKSDQSSDRSSVG